MRKSYKAKRIRQHRQKDTHLLYNPKMFIIIVFYPVTQRIANGQDFFTIVLLTCWNRNMLYLFYEPNK